MNSRRYLFIALVSLGLALTTGACSQRSDAQRAMDRAMAKSKESDRYSFTRFLDAVKVYPYVAPPKKVVRIRNGYKRLALGIDKKLALKYMGPPDGELLMSNRTPHGWKHVYSTWGYCLKRQERTLANRSVDQEIVLFFKSDGTLYWVLPENVTGLKPLGGPQLNPSGLIRVRRQ